MKRIAFFLISLAFLLNSCDEKLHYPQPYFIITDILSYNKGFKNEEEKYPNQVYENDTLRWDSFFISYQFMVDFTDSLFSAEDESKKKTSPLLPGYKGCYTGIDTLYLITRFPYNQEYSAGDTINDIILMNIGAYSRNSFERFFSIEDYIERYNVNILEPCFDVKPLEAPDSSKLCSFEVIYQLDNGDVFTNTSEAVYLTTK